jgi:predicted kinase
VPAGGFVLLNAWLETSGDYEGLGILDLCRSYRAVVRAKVALLAGRPPVESDSPPHLQFRRYAALASSFGQPRQRFLAITCGVSGSGKSTVALALAGEIRGIRIRSDVERKRLFGLAADADTRLPGMPDIYTREAGANTFARLEELAATVIAAGYPVILDATFIRRGLRERFRALATRLGVPFVVLHCDAPKDELRRRVAARHAAGTDASEADIAVLESQLAVCEPPDPALEPGTLRVVGDDASSLTQLLGALRALVFPAA